MKTRHFTDIMWFLKCPNIIYVQSDKENVQNSFYTVVKIYFYLVLLPHLLSNILRLFIFLSLEIKGEKYLRYLDIFFLVLKLCCCIQCVQYLLYMSWHLNNNWKKMYTLHKFIIINLKEKTMWLFCVCKVINVFYAMVENKTVFFEGFVRNMLCACNKLCNNVNFNSTDESFDCDLKFCNYYNYVIEILPIESVKWIFLTYHFFFVHNKHWID